MREGLVPRLVVVHVHVCVRQEMISYEQMIKTCNFDTCTCISFPIQIHAQKCGNCKFTSGGWGNIEEVHVASRV